MLATAPSSLIEAAELAYYQNQQRVVPFHWNEQLFYLKKAGRGTHSSIKAYISMIVCRLAFHQKYSKDSLEQGDIHDESARIRELQASGILVPRVETENDRYMVLQDAGTPLEQIIQPLSAEKRMQWYLRTIKELALLHQKHQWHGGAQLRNHSVKNDTIYRIDFEEKFGHVLPPDAVGAYDLFLLLGDILSRLDEQTYIQDGLKLVAYYEEVSGRHDVILRLSHLMWIRKILQGLSKVLSNKVRQSLDARRTLRFFDVMQAYLTKS